MAHVVSSVPRTVSSKTKSALILLDSGEHCEIVVTEDFRVTVSKKHDDEHQDILYQEEVAFRTLAAALGLFQRYPCARLPNGHIDFELSAFGGAILTCQDCAMVTALLHEAMEDARRLRVVYGVAMPPPQPRSRGA